MGLWCHGGKLPNQRKFGLLCQGKKSLVVFSSLFQKKKDTVVAQLTFWHGEITRNQFLNVFDGFWCGPSQHVNGSFVQLLNWFGLMEVDGGFDLPEVPESWYSWKLGESPGFLTLFHGFFCSAWPTEVSSLESGECWKFQSPFQERVLSRLTAFWRQPGIYPLNPLRRGWYLDCKTTRCLTGGNLFWGWTMIWW